MGDYEGTTTRVERKWHQVYVKSFEKSIVSYICNVILKGFMQTLLPQKTKTKDLRILCLYVLFVNLSHMRNGGIIPFLFVGNPYFENKLRFNTPSTRIM